MNALKRFASIADNNVSAHWRSCSTNTAASAWNEWISFRSICWVIAALFFIKFAAYGLFITPFWDIPDESGHYSYVENLSHGHYPVLGDALVARDVVDSWIGPDANQGRNWIAQHPPLFYALAAPVVAG